MSERQWHFYIEDMVGCAEWVIEFTHGIDRAAFADDRMRYDATVRNLELIGEACTHVPDAVRDAHPEVEWRKIIATRNVLIHGYLGIDDNVLWSIIRDDVPPLLAALRRLLAQLDPSDEH